LPANFLYEPFDTFLVGLVMEQTDKSQACGDTTYINRNDFWEIKSIRRHVNAIFVAEIVSIFLATNDQNVEATK
jgi:hypothetical protein